MESNRYNLIDIIKAFAIFAVVCLHTNPFLKVDIMGLNGKYLTFIIDTLSRFAVPYFFIVSGFLFSKNLAKKGNEYVINYIKKIAKLYFSWTFFYFIYFLSRSYLLSYYKQVSFRDNLIPEGSLETILEHLYKIFYGGFAGYHLWYLISLLWSILILYVFIKIKKVNHLMIFSFVLNLIGLFGSSYSGILSLTINSRDALFFGLFYCTLGYFLALNENLIRERLSKVKISYIYISLFSILAALFVERGLLIKYFNGTVNNGDFYVNSIPITILLMILVIVKKNSKGMIYLAKIGRKSLGVYVIHLAVLDSITTLLFGIMRYNPNSVLIQLILTPLVFTVSYLICGKFESLRERVVTYLYNVKGEQHLAKYN